MDDRRAHDDADRDPGHRDDRTERGRRDGGHWSVAIAALMRASPSLMSASLVA